jgi:hypothetical protein
MGLVAAVDLKADQDCGKDSGASPTQLLEQPPKLDVERR